MSVRLSIFLSLVSIVTVITSAQASAQEKDKKSAKLQIALTANPETDCKISIKEVGKLQSGEAKQPFLCGSLEGGKEATLASIYLGLAKGELTVTYSGANADSLMETIAAWKEFLLSRQGAVAESERASYLAQVEPYVLSLVSQNQDTVVLKIENSTANESVEFNVKMNAKH